MFEELLERLRRVLEVLGRTGLKLQARKCEFGMTATTYLGHHISAGGVAPDPMKVEAIASSRGRSTCGRSGGFWAWPGTIDTSFHNLPRSLRH